jgi:hypothetical protein
VLCARFRIEYVAYIPFQYICAEALCLSFGRLCTIRLWDGAYTNAEKYSRADVKQLVEYGRARGVKIMIEFDMPGTHRALNRRIILSRGAILC